MRKITLYIIDDDEDVVNALKAIFKPNKRYRVRPHTTVASVLADLDQCPPQLVLCDQVMPERDGVDLLGELKGRFPRLRSILLTGQQLDQQIMNGMKDGAFDLYISKPWNQGALEETVQRLAREVALDGTT